MTSAADSSNDGPCPAIQGSIQAAYLGYGTASVSSSVPSPVILWLTSVDVEFPVWQHIHRQTRHRLWWDVRSTDPGSLLPGLDGARTCDRFREVGRRECGADQPHRDYDDTRAVR